VSTGFGRTPWCLDGLLLGRYVSGRRALAQSIYRRLTTPRGTLRGGAEESAYGLDLAGLLGSVSTPAALAGIPAMVRAELLKDDRIADVQVTYTAVTEANGTAAVTLTANVTPADEAESFTLTIGVSDATVAIIGGLPA